MTAGGDHPMTDTPIRTHTTTLDREDIERGLVPGNWGPGTRVLVIAGLPEGAELRSVEPPDFPVDRPIVAFIHAPKPVPAPPATERVMWHEAIGRRHPEGGYITLARKSDLLASVDTDEETYLADRDGMVKVLVDPAPTGDDEPSEADNAPDLTPLFDALDSYDESPSADMPDVDRAVDALVDAVRALRGRDETIR